MWISHSVKLEKSVHHLDAARQHDISIFFAQIIRPSCYTTGAMLDTIHKAAQPGRPDESTVVDQTAGQRRGPGEIVSVTRRIGSQPRVGTPYYLGLVRAVVFPGDWDDDGMFG